MLRAREAQEMSSKSHGLRVGVKPVLKVVAIVTVIPAVNLYT